MAIVLELHPIHARGRFALEARGETLIVSGVEMDFSILAEGDEIPRDAIRSGMIRGPVRREGGDVIVPLMLTHGDGAPLETLFPEPLRVRADGPVTLPAYGRAPA